jgi:hypothetical protein
MNTPAAIARIARTGLRPFRAGISVNKPQAISQMASKSMPMFFVNLFMEVILLYGEI